MTRNLARYLAPDLDTLHQRVAEDRDARRMERKQRRAIRRAFFHSKKGK